MKNLDLIRIVDDDPDVREAVTFLLEGEGLETRVYASAEEFLENEDFFLPGCVVLDVQMPGKSGLELQDDLIAMSKIMPVIFVSAYGSIEMAVETVRKGAYDFLPKHVDEAKLLSSIAAACQRCREARQQKVSDSALQSDWDSLTAREKEIAVRLAQGVPNKVIAAECNIAVRTVQVHRAAIYVKLGIHSAAEITLMLGKLGMAAEG